MGRPLDLFGFRRRRQERLAAAPFPEEWAAIIDENVPHARMLDEDEEDRLHDLVQIFLGETRFEGAGGFEVDDEVRVTIAAQACLLLIGHDDTWVYPRLDSVVVYPSTFVSHATQHRGDGVVQEGPQARLGESWGAGTLVLAWDAVVRGAVGVADGQNVVFHEFAHQLDQEEPSSAGAPHLPKRAMYRRWAQVFGREFRELIEALEAGEKTLLDAYGATNAAEFFAVATEFFFERPRQVKARHPELYEQLALFYGQDPAVRVARDARARAEARKARRRRR